MRSQLLYFYLSLLTVFVVGAKTTVYAKPNIIFILADDVGWR